MSLSNSQFSILNSPLIPPGYKQTEVGVIPEDWEVRTIGEMFRLNNGCAFKPEDWKQSGVPIIRIQNLNDPTAEFNFSQAPVSEKNRIESGDLLFAWSGTLGSSFGARIWNGPSGVLNQHIFKVLMDEKQITLSYALLVFARVEEDIAKQAHGFKASFVHVKKSDLVKVDLPVPPLPEQQAIAAALSDVDALLAGLDQLITKKRDLKQASMQQLLTGQTRLPGFYGEWEVKSLSTICSMKSGEGITSGNIDLFSRYPCYGGNGLRGYAKRFTHEGGYALVRRQGALCGNVYGVEGQFFASEHAIVVTPSADTEIRWLTAVLGRMNLNQYSESSAQPGLSVTKILKLEITTPSTKAEQTAIAQVLTDMDAELSALEQRREKTRALKQAMMQELLTGRTRLVNG